ncbi:MAG TPA: RNA 2',3'-cyclic phosphodiesterase [Candidatus Cybelea sp.]|nr:RNA 2',3'-cyclic phosphodiesterase [Candidatus Cybelea sp.]
MAELARRRRLFVGIALDGAARARCAAISERLAQTGFDGRYEAPEKLHVTLAFLGNVDDAAVPPVIAALGESAAGRVPFSLTLDRLGAFPHERKPRVVYLGAREQGAAFRGLAAAARRAYEPLGFPFEKDAVAHVTIARVKEARRPLPNVEFAPIALAVASLALFESIFDAKANTSRYEVVDSVALGS